jgi:hypothetical protein
LFFGERRQELPTIQVDVRESKIGNFSKSR